MSDHSSGAIAFVAIAVGVGIVIGAAIVGVLWVLV